MLCFILDSINIITDKKFINFGLFFLKLELEIFY